MSITPAGRCGRGRPALMDKLKILMVASEAGPFARTGGLGDVLGALPKAISALGHEVKVFLPRYGFIDPAFKLTPFDWNVRIPAGDRSARLTIEHTRPGRSKVEYFFVCNSSLFDRSDFYIDPGTGKDYTDNDDRFAFFNRAVLETVKKIDWRPDIIHVHDWQAGLIPAYLKTAYASDPFFLSTRTVLTIHNLGYQGIFAGDRFPRLGLPSELFYAVTGAFEFFGKVNFLKGAISFADQVTTVSRRYASEIQSSAEFGCGLEGVLKGRARDLNGILNGVDYAIWSPTRDKKVPYKYTLANLSGKKKNKVELLVSAGLPVREKTPLIGMITRLTDQKGLDLIAEAATRLFALNIQMMILGTGDEKYQSLLRKLEIAHPDRLKVYLTFDDGLAHRIEAGSDCFLMPSRWEPCGLNQLYSLRYGTVPIVRSVGGLADTVLDFNPETGLGTGFVFREYEPEAMLTAIERAVVLFSRKRMWIKIIKNGMQQDYSWEKSAREYARLFERLAVR